MSRYWNDGISYSQPSSEELRQSAAASRKKEAARGKVLEPVVIQGRVIAKSWWGRVWCENLESYATYSSRLDRGKRYVRAGTVIDLKIQKGKILARVQGSRKTPYKVEVDISPVSDEKCQNIIQRCSRKVENLEQLLAGNFPEELKGLFQGKNGLFPAAKEIHFTCSCPDWASMCKHVAAVLYGVGARLDEQPTLFFELRGIDMSQFIDAVLGDKVESMLANAQKPSRRIIEGQDLQALFGVLEDI